ncbi:MAG: D-mannonate dehydratase [Edaphobacter sp.]|nr:D-mannonate dehydratase [Edaphobacter sp.]
MLTSRAGIRDPAGYRTLQAIKNSVDEQKLNDTVALAGLAWLEAWLCRVTRVQAPPVSRSGDEDLWRRSILRDAQEDLQCFFHNIRGHRNDFVEVYPDEGDVDLVKAIQVSRGGLSVSADAGPCAGCAE